MTRRLAIGASFNLAATFKGEQGLPLATPADGWHSGVLGGHVVHVRRVDGGLEYRAGENLGSLLGSYFRLDDELDAIWGDLTARDETLRKLHVQHGHVRLRRQPDRWECVVSYICSANKSVAGVRASVREDRGGARGARRAWWRPPPRVSLGGARARGRRGGSRGAGAGPRQAPEDRRRRAGDRGRTPRLEELARPGVHYGEARLRLMGCEGIGPKIADCIALFALDKLDAFPVDRWVRRAIRSRYFGGRVPSDQKLVAWRCEPSGRTPATRTSSSSTRSGGGRHALNTPSERVPRASRHAAESRAGAAQAPAGRGHDPGRREGTSLTGSRRASSPAGGSSTERHASSTTGA